MRIPLRETKALVIGAAMALVASACSVGAETGEDAADATIGFVSPSDGAAISVPFDVELEASEPLDEPATGNRHAHIYFDTSTDSADYDIVYGTTAQVTRDLAPGEHTLTVALATRTTPWSACGRRSPSPSERARAVPTMARPTPGRSRPRLLRPRSITERPSP